MEAGCAPPQRYRIPEADWLDLSTGIAPYGWTLPEVPAAAWARLPERDDGLEEAARQYYRAPSLLPVAGSQAAIQALPRLRRTSQVGILSPCYAEHGAAWRRVGHRLEEISEAGARRAIDRLDVLVVVNPNNPTGQRYSPELLLEWHARLAERGGWLVVDEAFMDCTGDQSLARVSHLPGLIVLRSFGKFFGLAGLRLASPAPLPSCSTRWRSCSAPGGQRPRAGHRQGPAAGCRRPGPAARAPAADGQRLARLLGSHGLQPTGGCSLFQWVAMPHAGVVHEYLAAHGILTRLFLTPSSLRFGLPPDEAGWQRLDTVLSGFARELA